MIILLNDELIARAAGKTVELETDRLRLRAWRMEDLEPFIALNSDPVVMKYFVEPWSAQHSLRSLTNILNHIAENGFGKLVVEIPGETEFAGLIGLKRVRWEAHFTPAVEFSGRLCSRYHGQGYGPEALRALAGFGFNRLGLKEIYGFTSLLNIPSRRMMEKAGMTYVEGADFDHPRIPDGHALKRHVLYRIAQRGDI